MFLVYGKYSPTEQIIIDLSGRYAVALDLFLKSRISGTYQIIEAISLSDFSHYRLVHNSEYVDILEKIRYSGKSVQGISLEAVEFERIGVGGTLTAVDLAINNKCFAYHIGGGYHHGMPDGPYSIDYCNDVAIALAFILKKGIKKILYIDLDVHHPNGVQKIFEEDDRIVQISLHGWPCNEDGHFTCIGRGNGLGTKINMPIPKHTGDKAYLKVLNALLVSVMRQYQPGAVFYQAGVDSYQKDPIGNLNLSLRGLYERDRLVALNCGSENIPFVACLGGGYNPIGSPRAIVNTLAAFGGKDIVFDESESIGAQTIDKLLRWYGLLRQLLKPYFQLDEIYR